MTMNNLHRLFQPETRDRTLLNALTLTAEEDEVLIEARRKVRDALREGLPRLIKKELPQIGTIAPPRFVTQGSYAYETINRLCHAGQQIDMDDGCYLPMSFAEEFEVGHASNVFFAAVETVLAPLARENGWRMVQKETCSRLELDATKHIDIPLYAIPDEEFDKLVKAAQLRGRFNDMNFTLESAQTIRWDDLPRNKVLLALRGGEWRPSDPRPVIQWVKMQAATKGEQWRRVIRYLKAWRDFQWPEGGPTSICLMAAADQVFPRSQERDDLALLQVVDGLAEVLAGDVYNPAEPDSNEILSKRLDENGLRVEVLSKIGSFGADLHRAIHGGVSPTDACQLVRRHLGSRIPFEPAWVTPVTATQVVQSTPARRSHKAPTIRSTKSA